MSHERMDKKLKRLREAGIKLVGEKLPVDYSSKRQTMEQAEAEVARQKRWDKRWQKGLERLNETVQGTLKLEGWQPTKPPSRQESLAHIDLINRIVKAKYKKRVQSVSLLQIYLEYKSVILDDEGKVHKWWPWNIHGKRWLDRRVNEAADPRFYESGVPWLVAATAGRYQPNSEVFEEAKP